MYFYQYFFNGPQCQLTTIKYDPNGNQLWVEGEEGIHASNVLVGGAVVDQKANYIVLANFVGGEPLPYTTTAFAPGGQGLWIANNPTGDFYSFGKGLCLDAAGNVLVSGMDAYNYPDASFGTFKLCSTNGLFVWTNQYPSNPTTVSTATSVVADSLGRAYVTGYSPGANTSNDIVTIAYDTNGKQLWLERYDGPAHGDDEGNAICVDTNGNVYVAGYDTPIGGGTEMVLIKYSRVTGQHEANGDFQLEAQGSPSEPFDIQASTNLDTWLDLGDFAADTNGLLQFTDTNAGLYPSRFYQAIPQ